MYPNFVLQIASSKIFKLRHDKEQLRCTLFLVFKTSNGQYFELKKKRVKLLLFVVIFAPCESNLVADKLINTLNL